MVIGLGVLMLAGRNPFERLPGARVPIMANPYGQAYLYGVMLGPLVLPCAGGFALALIAYSIGIGETLPRVATFIAYGLGLGLPLVLLSLLAGIRRQQLVRAVTRHHRTIEILGGDPAGPARSLGSGGQLGQHHADAPALTPTRISAARG